MVIMYCMAWRGYPKYQKKQKTYKDYVYLSYQEIKNKKNYYSNKIKEINDVLAKVENFKDSILLFKEKIDADERIIFHKRRLAYVEKQLTEISKQINQVMEYKKFKKPLSFFYQNPLTEEGQALIEELNQKKNKIIKERETHDDYLKRTYNHNSKKISHKKFSIYKKDYEFEPGSIDLRFFSSEYFSGIKEDAKYNIKKIDEFLLPINKAFEIIKKRHNLNEDKINKVKESAEQYKAHAYAAQKKSRDLGKEVDIDLNNQLAILNCCPYCELEIGNKPHKDHIYPISKGGLSTKENMVFVCDSCNLEKGAKTLREFVKIKGFDRSRIDKNLEILKKDF